MLPPQDARKIAQAAAEALRQATGARYVVVLVEGDNADGRVSIAMGAWVPTPATATALLLRAAASMLDESAVVLDLNVPKGPAS